MHIDDVKPQRYIARNIAQIGESPENTVEMK